MMNQYEPDPELLMFEAVVSASARPIGPTGWVAEKNGWPS
jgi:hypothetical protein